MSNYTPDPTPGPIPEPAGLEPEPVADLGTDPIADITADPIPTPLSEEAAGGASGPAADATAAARAAREPALGALYALAGLTDLVAASVRKSIADSAEEANRRRAEVQARLTERTQSATAGEASPEELRRLLAALPAQLKALPDLARERALVLQQQAEARYNELTGRGKKAVDGAVTSARGLTSKAEQRAGEVRTEVVERIDPALGVVQQRVAAARRTVAGDAKSPVYEPTAPAGTQPTTPTTVGGAGVGSVGVESEGFPPVDEVIISPAGHGDEVPPVFDAPATDVPPTTGGPSSPYAG